MRDESGTVIGDRYRLAKRIDVDDSGQLYRAEHKELGTPLTVKLLHAELSSDKGAVQRFHKEASTASLAESDHIVKVTDLGRTPDGRLFIAMENLVGESLAARLERQKRFGERETCHILEQVGDALSELHALGIVHGALQPRNIFLSLKKDKEVVKLLNLGVSGLVNRETQAVKDVDSSRSDDANPAYLSPEQIDRRPLDGRSDLYSLGIVAYEMVAGAPPFSGPSQEVVQHHLRTDPPDLRRQVPDLSPGFIAAICRALSKQSATRFPTVTRFLDVLSGRVPVESEGIFPAVTTPDEALSSNGAKEDIPAPAISPSLAATVRVPVDTADHPAEEKDSAEQAASPEAAAIDELHPPVNSRASAATDSSSASEVAPPRQDPSTEDHATKAINKAIGDDKNDPMSQTGTWFAEGDEAEKQIAQGSSQDDLPAMYRELDDEELPTTRLTAPVLIAVIAGIIALGVGAIFLILGDGEETEEPISQQRLTPTDQASIEKAKKQQQKASTSPTSKPTKVAENAEKAGENKGASGATTKNDRASSGPLEAPAASAPTLSQAQLKDKLQQARTAIDRGDYVGARKSLNEVIEASPEHTEAHRGLGEISFELGEYEQAVSSLQKALKASPSDTRSMVMLGNALFKLEKLKEATEYYRRVLKKEPKNAAAKAALRVALRRLKK